PGSPARKRRLAAAAAWLAPARAGAGAAALAGPHWRRGLESRAFPGGPRPGPARNGPPAGPRWSHWPQPGPRSVAGVAHRRNPRPPPFRRRAGPAAGRGPARSREHLPPDAVPVPHHAQWPPFRPPARPAGGYGRGRPDPPAVAAAQPLAGMEA